MRTWVVVAGLVMIGVASLRAAGQGDTQVTGPVTKAGVTCNVETFGMSMTLKGDRDSSQGPWLVARLSLEVYEDDCRFRAREPKWTSVLDEHRHEILETGSTETAPSGALRQRVVNECRDMWIHGRNGPDQLQPRAALQRFPERVARAMGSVAVLSVRREVVEKIKAEEAAEPVEIAPGLTFRMTHVERKGQEVHLSYEVRVKRGANGVKPGYEPIFVGLMASGGAVVRTRGAAEEVETGNEYVLSATDVVERYPRHGEWALDVCVFDGVAEVELEFEVANAVVTEAAEPADASGADKQAAAGERDHLERVAAKSDGVRWSVSRVRAAAEWRREWSSQTEQRWKATKTISASLELDGWREQAAPVEAVITEVVGTNGKNLVMPLVSYGRRNERDLMEQSLSRLLRPANLGEPALEVTANVSDLPRSIVRIAGHTELIVGDPVRTDVTPRETEESIEIGPGASLIWSEAQEGQGHYGPYTYEVHIERERGERAGFEPVFAGLVLNEGTGTERTHLSHRPRVVTAKEYLYLPETELNYGTDFLKQTKSWQACVFKDLRRERLEIEVRDLHAASGHDGADGPLAKDTINATSK